MKIILCSILMLITADAFADSMRCADEIVSAGDLAVSVIPKCKFPNSVIRGGDTEGKGRYTADSNKIMDEWIYESGSSGIRYKLTIINGVVSKIESLGVHADKKE